MDSLDEIFRNMHTYLSTAQDYYNNENIYDNGGYDFNDDNYYDINNKTKN